MITIFSGTNRPGSNTLKISRQYSKLLSIKGIEHQLFSLEQLPLNLFTNNMYDHLDTKTYSDVHLAIMEKYFIPVEKIVFVVPEYNGSFPGTFKAFIDASNVSACFHNKKCCLVGVANGRAGNLRGMEHLTNILNHIRMNVLHLKIPISQVSTHLDEHGDIKSPDILKMIESQIELFNSF